MPREIGCFRFRSLIAAEVGQGRLRLKSDVSDFAHLIAAEVGQGRLRLKARESGAFGGRTQCSNRNQGVTGSPAFAGDDTQGDAVISGRVLGIQSSGSTLTMALP